VLEAARWELLVKRDDLEATEVRRVPPPKLDADQVELAVERIALTMNNVTYAWCGDPEMMNFWVMFPAPDPAWGRVPVWGYVRVSRSEHPDYAVGDRYFGLLPMSSHHIVRPGRVPTGFVDTTPDRHFPYPWYQTFHAVGPADDRDDRRTLLRPIYPASFHAADFVAGQAGEGLTALITSASSKVAIGVAHRLRGNANVRTIGVTSEHNREFVTGLGLYDEITGYQELPAIDGPVLCLEMTGDNDLLATIHSTYRDRLLHVALLGWTRSVRPPEGLTDPTPEIFFAPGVEAMTIEAEGQDAYFARYSAAEDEFADATESWLTIANDNGPDAVAAVFRGLVNGTHPTNHCTILGP
jgi:hypothetical protein